MTGSTTDAAKPRRVLVAEDEALIRLDLAEMLREEGYEVVGEAGDGQEAVELAESLKPDLVIMDVKMPRRDGIDAASEIASKRIAPIVVLTAFSQRELVERARDAGAMAYLVKPFSITDLIPAIEVAVSRFSEISALEQEVATLSRPAGDPQAGRAREGFAANQAGDDRTRGVQVDSARGDGSPNDDEACRRGGAGNPRPARGRVNTAFPTPPFDAIYLEIQRRAFSNITHHGHTLAMFYPKHRRPGRSGPARRCR